MNLDTLKEILSTFEQYRNDILSNSFDAREIFTGILSFLIEELKHEIEKNKTSNIYK